MTRKWIFLALLFSLWVGACSTAMSEEMYYETSSSPAPAAGAPREFLSAEDTNTSFNFSNPAQVERVVIRNGSLSISVVDVEDTLKKAVALADDLEGYVVSSQLYRRTLANGAELPQAEISLRVPAQQFVAALDSLSGYGLEVLSRNETGQDVTQQYTDLQSRLRNLESAETALQNILEKAEKTEDVLNVFNQLTQVRGEIEVIKGQIKYYEESAAISLIEVTIIAEQAVQPLRIGGWQPGGVAKEALQALIDTFEFLLNALIWLGIYIVPVALVIFGLLIPLRWGLRLLRALWRRVMPKSEKTPKADKS